MVNTVLQIAAMVNTVQKKRLQLKKSRKPRMSVPLPACNLKSRNRTPSAALGAPPPPARTVQPDPDDEENKLDEAGAMDVEPLVVPPSQPEPIVKNYRVQWTAGMDCITLSSADGKRKFRYIISKFLY